MQDGPEKKPVKDGGKDDSDEDDDKKKLQVRRVGEREEKRAVSPL